MKISSVAVLMGGDFPASGHPARKPVELNDDEAFGLIERGIAEPSGDAAVKRYEAMRAEKEAAARGEERDTEAEIAEGRATVRTEAPGTQAPTTVTEQRQPVGRAR